MVRAGVVTHPSMWSYRDHNEIQEPRRKNVLIDYRSLQRLIGAGSYDELRSSHKGRVEEYLAEGANRREGEWTGGIALGSQSFVERAKELLGFRAKGISSGRSLVPISLFGGAKTRT